MLEPSFTRAQKVRHHFTTPLRDLLKDSRAAGVLLIGCAFISLWLSNGAQGAWYMRLWNSEMAIFNGLHLPNTLLSWVNDFAMAFFFVLVTTEIKRELVAGELSTFKKAILPF